MATQASPNFTVGNVHVSAPLTQLSIGYHPMGMIAEQIFPVIRVNHENDLYYVWDQAQAFRLERGDGYDDMRADGSEARTESYGATLKSYQAYEFARRTTVTDRERANADSVLQLETSKIRRTQDKILLNQELRIGKILTTTANYDSTNFVTLAGTSQWNNASFASQNTATQSVIKKNIDDGKEGIRSATGGLEANTIVVPAAVARVMARDVGIVEQVKYTHPDLLVGGYLPQTLWGMKVLMPTAIYSTSVEGEVPTYTDVWGKNVILAYVNPNPGVDSITAGSIFRARDWQVKTWRDEAIDTTFYQASLVQTEVLVAKQAAYLIQNAIA